MNAASTAAAAPAAAAVAAAAGAGASAATTVAAAPAAPLVAAPVVAVAAAADALAAGWVANPVLSTCCVCSQVIQGVSRAQIIYSAHLRTHHKDSYRCVEAQLKTLGVVLCQKGGEARAACKDGSVWKHKCSAAYTDAAVRMEEGSQEDVGPDIVVGAHTYKGQPWPENCPLPPSSMLHPNEYACTGELVKKVPVQNLHFWAETVTENMGRLADAVVFADNGEIADALDKVLRMPGALAKPERGGRKRVYRAINKALKNLEDPDSRPEPPRSYASAPSGISSLAKAAAAHDAEKSRVRRAEGLVRSGHRRKAAVLLRSDDQVVEATPEVQARVAAKFPASRQPIAGLNPVQDDTPRFLMTCEDFIKSIKKFNNGAAGGGTGLTGQHIASVIEYPDVASALLRVLTLLIDGAFPSWAHPYICTQRLIALGTKERPVCISEWLMRTASRLTDRVIPAAETTNFFLGQHVDENFKVFQFGNNVSGGAEAAVFMLGKVARERDMGRVIVSKDGSNAYNSTDRVHAVNMTMKTFPSSARWLSWCYSTPAMLMHGESVVWGREGAFQGDGMGGRIHDTGLHDALIVAAKRVKDEWDVAIGDQQRKEADGEEGVDSSTPIEKKELCLVAFRDDLYVIGTPLTACFANKVIDEVRQSMTGVVENREKTSAFCSHLSFTDIYTHASAMKIVRENTYIKHERISDEGMKALGAPIGSDAYIDDYMDTSLHKYPSFLPRLRMMDPQCALILLRECYLPIATHLIRMVHPDHTIPHARVLDREIYETYKTITGDELILMENPAYTNTFKQCGMGFRSVAATAPAAHFASCVQSMSTLSKIDPTFAHDLHACLTILPDPSGRSSSPSRSADGASAPASSVASSSSALPAQINEIAEEQEMELEAEQSEFDQMSGSCQILWKAYTTAWNSSPQLHTLPESAVPPTFHQLISSLNNTSYKPRKLQHTITEQIEKIRFSETNQQLSDVDRARTTSTRTSGSTAAFTALPTTTNTSMPPEVVQFLTKYRAGTLKLPDRACVCGHPEMSPEHVLSCKKMRGLFVRHDLIVAVLRKMCARAGIPTTWEVMVIEGKQMRMDLVLHFSTGRKWIDVSIVNPQRPSYVDKDATKAREGEKRAKWGELAKENNVGFSAFVMDTFGRLGEEATATLEKIAHYACLNNPYPTMDSPEVWEGRYRRELVVRLSVTLGHANYCIVEEAGLKSMRSYISTAAMYRGLKEKGWY
jgi:hypothetical protein